MTKSANEGKGLVMGAGMGAKGNEGCGHNEEGGVGGGCERS